MKLFKLITGALIFGVIVLFIWQNVPTFKSSLPFKLNLYIGEELTWSHALYTLLLFSCAIGFMVGILLMLKPYFNVRRLLAQERQMRVNSEQGISPVKTPSAEEPPPAVVVPEVEVVPEEGDGR